MTSTSNQPLAIITGSSSGVGLYAAKALLARNWRLILAVRDPQNMESVSKTHKFDSSQY
jgi:protochlorophyllide reductase